MARRLIWLLLAPLWLGAADVTGKWVLQVQLSAGSGSPTFTFQQSGERLSGRYQGALGEADVTGTVKGDDIEFQFTVKSDLGEWTAKYKGKVSGDAMRGRCDYGPAAGEGTFEGKRQK